VTTALSHLYKQDILQRESGGWLLRGTVRPALLETDDAGPTGRNEERR